MPLVDLTLAIVKSKIFLSILFSRIVLKDIIGMLKIRN